MGDAGAGMKLLSGLTLSFQFGLLGSSLTPT